MPTYVYACTECGHRFEQHQAFTDEALTECPECGSRLRKVFNSVGVVFKGSGFYRTDSRGKEPAASNGSDAKGSESKGSDGKGSESKGSDVKSSDGKASESKGSDTTKAAGKGSGGTGSGSGGAGSGSTGSAGSTKKAAPAATGAA